MTTQLYMEIINWLRQTVAQTKWEGHVFAVGGCCRDLILGLEIKDIDLAVDLPMGGVKLARWLQKKHLTLEPPIVFLKYGTAKLRLRQFPDDEIELVQTRREQYTKATSRCPEVTFGTIEEDCYRRDFTVNSLYYDITRDKTVDITGLGIPDMKAGLLRTPMDPDETFNDDPVRILRALRFANRFGWRIDEAVYAALLRQIPRLVIVSRERIRTELAKMLCGPAPVEMMQTLRQTGILPYMVPILTGTYEPLDNGDEAPEPPLWDQSMRALGALSADAPLPARLAALFVGIGKLRTRSVRKKTGLVRYPNFERIGADMTRRILRQMKYERAEYNAAAALVAAQHDGLIYPELLDSMTAEQLDPKGAATAKTRRRRHRGGRRRRKSPAKKQ